jgi:hypothetical protein
MTSVAVNVNVNVQLAQATRIECPCVPTLCPPPKREDDTGLGGLVALGTGRALPLRQVKVRSEIVGNCARTVVEQRFGNDLSEPIEAVHIFPLPPAGAVVEMELHAGDTVVVADCREKEEATRTFEAARQSGHRAALLTQERADVHTLRVTRIPPGAEIRVRIVVIQAIESQDGLFRWRFPTVVAPRYHSGTAVGHTGPGTAAGHGPRPGRLAHLPADPPRRRHRAGPRGRGPRARVGDQRLVARRGDEDGGRQRAGRPRGQRHARPRLRARLRPGREPRRPRCAPSRTAPARWWWPARPGTACPRPCPATRSSWSTSPARWTARR